MATKEQNLKRLDELALILGREPDISGSAAEIAQRWSGVSIARGNLVWGDFTSDERAVNGPGPG